VGHILRRYPKGSRIHGFQRGAVEPPAHAERPTSFHDSSVFVYRMSVGKSDISCVLMNTKHKQHVSLSGDNRDMEIVGVSKNARYGELTKEFRPVVYIAYNQGFPRPERMVYALRTAGDPLAIVNSVREITRRADARGRDRAAQAVGFRRRQGDVAALEAILDGGVPVDTKLGVAFPQRPLSLRSWSLTAARQAIVASSAVLRAAESLPWQWRPIATSSDPHQPRDFWS
jgi:hypothetical protein